MRGVISNRLFDIGFDIINIGQGREGPVLIFTYIVKVESYLRELINCSSLTVLITVVTSTVLEILTIHLLLLLLLLPLDQTLDLGVAVIFIFIDLVLVDVLVVRVL
jgi:hypothetical protein